MAVASYIRDLLFRYECVILPGFGAFITRQKSATVDSETQEFFPPRKSVFFNRRLDQNDGLLANYIAAVEGVSYQVALLKIRDFVTDLNHILSQKRKVDLLHIGSFELVHGDKIQFEPSGEINYLTEAFGLGPFHRPAIVRPSAVEMEPETHHKATSQRWLKYAAVGIITLGLSGAGGLNFYSKQVTEHNMAEQQEARNLLENQIQKATFFIESPLPAVTFKVSKQSGDFHVVAGAFRLEENAEEKVQELRDLGYKARRIAPNRFGLHQVLYSSHETRRDAINALHAVKKSANPGAWLLVQKL